MTRAWRSGQDSAQRADQGQDGSGHQNRSGGAQRGAGGPESTEAILSRMVSRKLEASVMASILAEPTMMADLVEEVRLEDFVVEPFSTAYRIAAELWEERIPFDLPIASSRMDQDDVFDLMEGIEHSAQIGYGVYYAREVAKLGQRRDAVRAMGEAISQIVESPDIEVARTLSHMNQKVVREGRDIRARRIRQIADDSIQRLRDERDGIVQRGQITSGYRSLDELLGGGFSPGDLVILAARPSMGKTQLASDVLVNSSDTPGYPNTAVMFSAEMSGDSIVRRFGSRISGISLANIRSGQMDEDDFRKVEDAVDGIGNVDVVIDDTRGITTEQMKLTIQHTQQEGPVGLVVFDYMEMAGDDSDIPNVNETARISDVVKRLKDIAMECEVPLMALSQVGRQVDQRRNKVPGMSDLRMSAMIEQTADVVMFMYRHDYYIERGTEQYDASRANLMELHIAKNRNGAIGRVDLGYDAEKLVFLDLSGGVREEDWI